MNYTTLYASTKDTVFLYDLGGMKILAKIPADNHLGRIALSPDSRHFPYLIYSTSFKRGELILFDTNTLEEVNKILCHKTIILKVNISFSGAMAATCSTNGATIRVFSLP
eukprot:CAMPEP_0170561834 /NCGR_PEP_ID=MMETSP0211-20121228/57278_1 /TAXON_ID=311385 /ORGANISM="Pseudokeronopsis sp., Strain OXSARD2" /LENGTH=109 /DNA_ID=CAMNT_0010877895 /DNA_START=247 /DNA_END=576 /DNA_ORIENTATION=-